MMKYVLSRVIFIVATACVAIEGLTPVLAQTAPTPTGEPGLYNYGNVAQPTPPPNTDPGILPPSPTPVVTPVAGSAGCPQVIGYTCYNPATDKEGGLTKVTQWTNQAVGDGVKAGLVGGPGVDDIDYRMGMEDSINHLYRDCLSEAYWDTSQRALGIYAKYPFGQKDPSSSPPYATPLSLGDEQRSGHNNPDGMMQVCNFTARFGFSTPTTWRTSRWHLEPDLCDTGPGTPAGHGVFDNEAACVVPEPPFPNRDLPYPPPNPTPSPSPAVYQVPDCPGLKRTIDASKLPPSIYGKVNLCNGTGTQPGNGNEVCTSTSTGTYGTGDSAPTAGSLFWQITKGTIYPISQGFGMTDYASEVDPDNPPKLIADTVYSYTQSYGIRGHGGVDVAVPLKTQLYSIVSGTVKIVSGPVFYFGSDPSAQGPDQGELMIEDDQGNQLIYGHMYKINVSVGDRVNVGDLLGLSGEEGTGAHVHLEYRHKNTSADTPTPGGYTLQDPRDVFGCTPSGNTGGTTPVTTGGTTFAQFQAKYGFPSSSGPSGLDIATKYAQQFGQERDLALQYASQVGVEPEMIVWWTYAETNGSRDSYHYSNCEGDYTLDKDCPGLISGDWQIGYGQQYSMYTLLENAFRATHGDPNDSTLVQQVGQDVLTKSGINRSFPYEPVSQIVKEAQDYTQKAGGLSGVGVAYTLMRDPAISVYLLGKEIAGDIAHANSEGKTYVAMTCEWDFGQPYYCLSSTWINYANILNDVLIAWGLVPSSPGTAPGAACTGIIGNGTGTCSTEPDNLNGLTLDNFTALINQNMDAYKQIAQCANVPWQMMAAINLIESGLANYVPVTPTNGGGPWQFDPPPTTFDPNDFVTAGCKAAQLFLQPAAQDSTYSTGKPLRLNMDPANHDDENTIKAAFWGYNGHTDFADLNPGCTEDTDGNPNWNWDCAPYVMNNYDENHMNMAFRGTFQGSPLQEIHPTWDGAWKVFYKLYYSTYGPDGKLLVYGGNCSQTIGTNGGIALPTEANKQILTQFGQNGTPGINIGAAAGDPVFAMVDGTVVDSGWNTTGGYYAILGYTASGGSGTQRWIYYGHLDPNGLAAKGSVLKAGQQIGKVGPLQVVPPATPGQTNPPPPVTNGVETQPQLHFDIRTQIGEDLKTSITPCSISTFRTGYPSLDCVNYSGGLPWN